MSVIGVNEIGKGMKTTKFGTDYYAQVKKFNMILRTTCTVNQHRFL